MAIQFFAIIPQGTATRGAVDLPVNIGGWLGVHDDAIAEKARTERHRVVKWS